MTTGVGARSVIDWPAKGTGPDERNRRGPLSAGQQAMNVGLRHLQFVLPASGTVARLRPVLLDYARECPDVDIRLVARPKAALFMDLKADALDVAIFTGRATDDGIVSMSLWSERILLAVPES